MSFPKIEIKTVGEDSKLTEIYIDGHKLSGVRRFTLTQETGDSFPILTVDIAALNLRTDAVCSLRQFGIDSDIKQIIFDEPYT